MGLPFQISGPRDFGAQTAGPFSLPVLAGWGSVTIYDKWGRVVIRLYI